MNKLSLFILMWAFPLAVNAQNESKISHYLFPKFEKAHIKMLAGKTNEAEMNYNTVTEEMVYNASGTLLALDRIENIDTVYIHDLKFIPIGKRFYEIAYKGSVSLFIQHRTTLSSAGKPSGYGGTTQTSAVTSIKSLSTAGGIYALKLPEDLIVSNATLNWIRFNNEMQSFINERQLIRILPDKKEVIRKFVDDNEIDFKKKEDLVRLIQFLNNN